MPRAKKSSNSKHQFDGTDNHRYPNNYPVHEYSARVVGLMDETHASSQRVRMDAINKNQYNTTLPVDDSSPDLAIHPSFSMGTNASAEIMQKHPTRDFVTVYEYKLGNHVILWDYVIGWVYITSIWKAIGNYKADVLKLVSTSPEIKNKVYKTKGGCLKVQGTWIQYDVAKQLASKFCWPIRFALVPLFGSDFVDLCLHSGQPGYGLFQLAVSEKDLNKKKRRKRKLGLKDADTPSSLAGGAKKDNAVYSDAADDDEDYSEDIARKRRSRPGTRRQKKGEEQASSSPPLDTPYHSPTSLSPYSCQTLFSIQTQNQNHGAAAKESKPSSASNSASNSASSSFSLSSSTSLGSYHHYTPSGTATTELLVSPYLGKIYRSASTSGTRDAVLMFPKLSISAAADDNYKFKFHGHTYGDNRNSSPNTAAGNYVYNTVDDPHSATPSSSSSSSSAAVPAALPALSVDFSDQRVPRTSPGKHPRRRSSTSLLDSLLRVVSQEISGFAGPTGLAAAADDDASVPPVPLSAMLTVKPISLEDYRC